MKTQVNIQKCPLVGSVKSTEEPAAQVNIKIIQEFTAQANFLIIRGFVTMMNKFINPLIQPRYFLWLDGEKSDGKAITGYAVVDAKNKEAAIQNVKSLLRAMFPDANEFHFRNIRRGHENAHRLEALTIRCFPERVIQRGEYESI